MYISAWYLPLIMELKIEIFMSSDLYWIIDIWKRTFSLKIGCIHFAAHTKINILSNGLNWITISQIFFTHFAIQLHIQTGCRLDSNGISFPISKFDSLTIWLICWNHEKRVDFKKCKIKASYAVSMFLTTLKRVSFTNKFPAYVFVCVFMSTPSLVAKAIVVML